MAAPMPLVGETIAKWQEHLLQLDRRNNLLYFKTGTSSVAIPTTDIDAFLARLTATPKGLRFAWAERRLSSPSLSLPGIITPPASGIDASVSDGDIDADCPVLELQRRLKKLQKKDKEWLEEQGVNVLFLAVGMLNWIDIDGHMARAPLMLIPCDLSQPSPRDHFSLTREQDEAGINTTLRYKLTKDWGLTLPDIDDPDSAPTAYLQEVERLIARSVGRELVLATFQFSKLSMWEDLEQLRTEDEIEPLVCALAGDLSATAARRGPPGAIYEKRPADLAGGLIDDAIAPGVQHLVLPADYSQVLVVEQARSGQHLVVHGPPGTGKSQTIANVIGSLIADGKSVLFVSEKTAALDVVKRRLEDARLGVFCLDLHSDRGRKANVYLQLRQSLEDPRDISRGAVDYDAVKLRRSQLNSFVRALHLRREPLGQSLFQIHGEFAQLHSAPDAPLQFDPGAPIDASMRENLLLLARRVSQYPVEFREHETSRWLPLRPSRGTVTLANEIRASAALLDRLVATFAQEASKLAGFAGVETPTTGNGVRELSFLLTHLAQATGPVPPAWLDPAALARIRKLAQSEQATQLRRAELLSSLHPSFGEHPPALDYDSLQSTVDRIRLRTVEFEHLLGADWQTRAASPTGIDAAIDALPGAYGEASRSLAGLAEILGHSSPRTHGGAGELLSLADSVVRLAPVPDSWMSSVTTVAASERLIAAQIAAAALSEHEAELFSDFGEELLTAVDAEMLVRYRTDYRGFFKRLGGAFKRDQRTLRGCKRSTGELTLDQATTAIDRALKLRTERTHWDGLATALQAQLGRRFKGRETSWTTVEAERADTAALLAEEASNPRLQSLLASEPLQVRIARDESSKAIDALDTIESALRVGPAPGREPLDSLLLPARAVAGDAKSLVQLLDTLRPFLQRGVPTLAALASLMDDAAHLSSIERGSLSRAAALRLDLGDRFQEFESDWSSILGAIDWTERLFTLAGSPALGKLAAHALQPLAPERYLDEFRRCEDAWLSFDEGAKEMDWQFDAAMTSWGSWSAAPFEMLRAWGADLAAHADEAINWLSYREAVAEFERMCGPGAISHIRAATNDATSIPAIADRRLLGHWLEQVYAQEPAMRTFAAEGHNQLLREFADLDRQSTLADRYDIRRRVFERYPDKYATNAAAGEVATLRGQLSRKRNLMPVRRLFRQIPNLVQALKPCFMMSPLAVSQYLPRSPLASETIGFDVVIFDEASQVFPEDAIPAIARAGQAIVVGDEKQLPPTSFFRKAADDDEEEDWSDDALPETEVNALKGRDSILEALAGLIGSAVGERDLLVHYRSKHEDLIRFSNHEFYGDRLQVFPSPYLSSAGIGLHDVYLPHGRYDSGATRTNPVEAEKTVDLVFQLMRTCPLDESIGVVTLSRAQADLIETLIDRRRQSESDVEGRFSPALHEPFFVKNLENVQGDERDHIILTIGYGPIAATGKVFNRFGPINAEGGGRRLNVAVSRARQSMTVVHSLRAADIVSQQPGSILLKRYLEFVADPATAILARLSVNPDAETESPFEDAVMRALSERGHDVQPQVGVSGYRIDLAIFNAERTGFDLAIECDGYTYHSSPAARDRDWLRQSILEKLGWSFHRVWSTAWARNPTAEIEAIEAALARARATTPRAFEAPAPGEPIAPPLAARPPEPVIPETPVPRSMNLFEPYEEARLGEFRTIGQLSEESDRTLHPMLLRIAEVEGPVHFEVALERLRARYGMGRAGDPTRERVRSSLSKLQAQQEIEIVSEASGLFFTRSNQPVVPRRPDTPESWRRPIAHISLAELEEGLLRVARAIYSAPREELSKECSRQFGYDRMGAEIAARLSGAIDGLIEDGRLSETFDGRLQA